MSFDDVHKASKPVERLTERLAVRDAARAESVKADELKEHFTCFYNRIYPLLKQNMLDFQRLAEMTGCKERRVRETLMFRLSAGEVVQLFGRREGYCYICSCRQDAAARQEPMCAVCLEALDTAIATLQAEAGDCGLLRLPVPLSDDDADLTTADEVCAAADADGLPAEAETPDEAISRAEYDRLVAELDGYRARYGPLETLELSGSDLSPLALVTEDDLEAVKNAENGISEDMETADPAKNQEPAFEPDQVDALNVLYDELMDASELPTDAVTEPAASLPPAVDPEELLCILTSGDVALNELDLSGLPELKENEPLRHFGFQRYKAKY